VSQVLTSARATSVYTQGAIFYDVFLVSASSNGRECELYLSVCTRASVSAAECVV
jgi:hypothetical protein